MLKHMSVLMLLAASMAWAEPAAAPRPVPSEKRLPSAEAPAAPEPKTYAYPPPAWAEFLKTVDKDLLGGWQSLGAGRFRPVDTAARELLRLFFDGRLHNIETLAYKDADGKTVLEPPAVTLWGVSLAPRQYYDAPLFTLVSDKLRERLFGHHLAAYEGRIKAAKEAGDETLAADLQAKHDAYKGRVMNPSKPHAAAYREILDELLAAYVRRTAKLSAADRDPFGGASGDGGAAAGRSRKARLFAERLASLDTLNSVQRTELRRELVEDFRDSQAAGGGDGGRYADHLNSHMNALARKLENFEQAGAQLQLLPVSSDAAVGWEPPDALALKVAGVNDRKMIRASLDSTPLESIELPAGTFVLPEGWEEVDEAGLRAFVGKWRELRALFAAGGDAAKANALAAELHSILDNSHPTIRLGVTGKALYYPSDGRMAAELWYNGHGKLTWVWWFFVLSAVLLSAAMSFRNRFFLALGLLSYGASLLISSAGFGFRLFLAQRGSAFSIPISSQFESLLWCLFFGCIVATVLCAVSRSWTSVACLIGVSVLGALLMVLSDFMPIGVSTEVTPENPVLRAALLPFHVGSMVGGYALIAIAALPAAYYMIRWFRSGGDAEERIELTNIDRFHNLILQGVFAMLAVGLILGAAWGDVAWGRWWGWDPKETWAFITWMVYLLIIHVRLIVRDRGPLTACMSMWGFTVMLFTWFGTNYGLTRGVLHAYSGVEGGSVHNVVPYIWLTLTVLMPVTGGFMPGGVALAARSVHLSRTDREAAGGKNLLLAALAAWGFLAFGLGLLYWKHDATPAGMWQWFWPGPNAPTDAGVVFPHLSAEEAENWAPTVLLSLWAVIVAALSFTLGWLITLAADKTPGYNRK